MSLEEHTQGFGGLDQDETGRLYGCKGFPAWTEQGLRRKLIPEARAELDPSLISDEMQKAAELVLALNPVDARRTLMAGIEVFRELPVETIRPGSTLYQHGDRNNGVYILKSGSVVKSDANGRMIQIADAFTFFGSEAFSGARERQSNVQAVTDCDVSSIAPYELGRIIDQNREVRWLFNISQSVDSAQSSRLSDMMQGDLRHRVCFMLEELGQRADGSLLFSQRDLAVFSGSTRESLNRQLGELKAEGVLDTDGLHKGLRVNLGRIADAGDRPRHVNNIFNLPTKDWRQAK